MDEAQEIAKKIAQGQRHEMFMTWMVSATEAKKPIEWEWFVRKNFLEGNQHIKYDPESKMVVNTSNTKDFKTTINKIAPAVRAIKNYVVKADPKWDIISTDATNTVFNKSLSAQKFMDTYWIDERLKIKSKEVVGDGLYSSIGVFWGYWDGARKWFCTDSVDPFDFLPDPTATDVYTFKDAKFVARTFKKKKSDLLMDKRLINVEDAPITSDHANSPIKNMLVELTSGISKEAYAGNKDLEGVILFDIYYKQDQPNRLGGQIGRAVISSEGIHLEEDTRFIDYPTRIYRTDTDTKRMYTQGWIKNLIAPQRIINELESNDLEYHHIFTKGRYVTTKGSGLRIILNRNGQILTINKNGRLEQLPMQSTPASHANQINRANQYLEDISANQEAFRGQLPTGATSGRSIEALMLGSENNLIDLRDNFDIFLVEWAGVVLQGFARHLQEPKTFPNKNKRTGELDFFSIIGDTSPIKPKSVTVTYNNMGEINVGVDRIMERNIIRVKVGTWLGTGILDSRKTLMELFSTGVLQAEDVLEYYEAPNIPEILKRKRDNAISEMNIQNSLKQEPGTGQALDSMSMGQANVPGMPNPSNPIPLPNQGE